MFLRVFMFIQKRGSGVFKYLFLSRPLQVSGEFIFKFAHKAPKMSLKWRTQVYFENVIICSMISCIVLKIAMLAKIESTIYFFSRKRDFQNLKKNNFSKMENRTKKLNTDLF